MFHDMFTQFDRLDRDLFAAVDGMISAPVDIRRDGDRYVIDADLPGIDPGSVDVTVEGDSLTISAERSNDRTTEDAQWVVRERSTSQVMRRIDLGEGMDPGGIEATYHDGVLSVVVPVAPTTRRHKIPVAVDSVEPAALGGSKQRRATEGEGGRLARFARDVPRGRHAGRSAARRMHGWLADRLAHREVAR